jgi:hypothetical protein
MFARKTLLRSAAVKGASHKLFAKASAAQLNAVRHQSDKPPTRVTLEIAKMLPKNYDQMPNDILLNMAG